MSDFKLKVGSLLQPKVLPFDTGYAIVTNHSPGTWELDLYYIVTDFGNCLALTRDEILTKYEVYGFEYNIKERLHNQIERLTFMMEHIDD